MKRNAIILAAGRSKRLAPFTYEKPKGIFKVKNQVLIDRQIEQLKEAGIDEIYVVVGFMKEKFFYLEEKYGVKLLVNNTFETKGNIYSLYVARQYLANTYICCADQYFVENPFLEDYSEVSYRACTYHHEKFREFSVAISDSDVITDFSIGGKESYCMVGHAYFTQKFSQKFVSLLEEEIDDFGISSMFWEEFYARHQKQLTLYAKYYQSDDIWEFDSIEELRGFDEAFLMNVDSAIVQNICSVLNCIPNDIVNINIIQKGLTNVSFSFDVRGITYVYRHPGGTAGNLVDREAELYAQYKVKELGLDKSLIYMDASGWKISYYVQNLIECDLDNNNDQLEKAMEYLRILHQSDFKTVKNFDTFQEALKLMRIASATKGNLMEEFADLVQKVERLDVHLKKDGFARVLCHNDTYAPNYLVTSDGDMYLIDWEYTGVNDPANDMACILCRYDFTDEQIEHYLRTYFQRELNQKEHRHYIAYIALCGFYWFCWGLYKGSVNDDDGFFMLPAYRNCIRFIDEALQSYEGK
jgi:CTP:phosphocholine cytidylyltransferase-like protein/thiamine kinase-like enzyme